MALASCPLGGCVYLLEASYRPKWQPSQLDVHSQTCTLFPMLPWLQVGTAGCGAGAAGGGLRGAQDGHEHRPAAEHRGRNRHHSGGAHPAQLCSQRFPRQTAARRCRWLHQARYLLHACSLKQLQRPVVNAAGLMRAYLVLWGPCLWRCAARIGAK